MGPDLQLQRELTQLGDFKSPLYFLILKYFNYEACQTCSSAALWHQGVIASA